MPGPRPALLLLALLAALLVHGGRGSPARPTVSRATSKGPMLGRAMPLEVLNAMDAPQQPIGSFASTKPPQTTSAGPDVISSTSLGSTVSSTVGSSVGSTVDNPVSSVTTTVGVSDGSTTPGPTTASSSTSSEEESTTAPPTPTSTSTSSTEAEAEVTATDKRRHHGGRSSSRRRDPADALASSKSLDMGGVGVRSQYDAPEEAPLRKAMLRVVLLPHRHDDDEQDGGEDGAEGRAMAHAGKHVRSRMMPLHAPQDADKPDRPHGAVPMVRIVSSQQIRILSDDPASRPGIMLSYDNDPESSVVFTSRRKNTEVHMPSAVLHGKAAADGVHHNSKLIFTIEHSSEGGENGTGRSDGQSILLQDTMTVPASGAAPMSLAFAMPSPMLGGLSGGGVPALPALPTPASPGPPPAQEQQPVEAAVVTAQPAALPVSPTSFEAQPAALAEPEASSAPPAAAPQPLPAPGPGPVPAAPTPQGPEPAALPDLPSLVIGSDPTLVSPSSPAVVLALDAAASTAPAPAAAPAEDALAQSAGAPQTFPFLLPPVPQGALPFGSPDAPPTGPVRSRMMHRMEPGHPDADDGHDAHDTPVMSRAMARSPEHDEDRWPKLPTHITPAPDAARHPAARIALAALASLASTTTRRPASSASSTPPATTHSGQPDQPQGLHRDAREEPAKSTAFSRKGPPLGHSTGASTTTSTVAASNGTTTRATTPASPRRSARTTKPPQPAAG